MLAIVLGKFAAVYFIVSGLKLEDGPPTISHGDMIAGTADQICRDRTAKGRHLAWPAGMSLDKATREQDYPRDVWEEARVRWTKLGAQEQQRQIDERKKQMAAGMKEVAAMLRREGFKSSFSPFDLLWFFLATATAFKIGSGMASDNG